MRMHVAMALLGMFLGSANMLQAQTTNLKASTQAPVPDLSKMDIRSILNQMQTATAPASNEAPSPIQIVVQFLQLRPDQQQVFGQLLQARQTVVVPLLQGIQQRLQQLEILLNSGGNPAEVGMLVIQIHGLQQQVAQAQQAFLANFANLLDAEQQQRLRAIQIASQLQPILPAFQVLYLF